VTSPQSVQNKQQSNEVTGTSEAFQLILNEAGLLDSKTLMLDITKLLQENANILPSQPRVIVGSNWMEGGGGGAPGPGRGMTQEPVDQQGIAIPKRQVHVRNTDEGLHMGVSGQQVPPSGSSYGVSPVAATSYGVSPQAATSYGVSPQQPHIVWGPGCVEIKEENNGTSQSLNMPPSYQPVRKDRNIYGTEPTLAQLNSPPNEETTLTTLNNLEDLSGLGVDLDILATELWPQTADPHFADIKIEPGQGGNNLGMNIFQWGKESQLSSSVPVSVISNTHSIVSNTQDLQDLSNLSNGGPAISPRHMTLSPSSVALSPTPLSPQSRLNLSPNSQPASPLQMQGGGMGLNPRSPHSSALHELLMRQQQDTQQQVPDPIRSRSNSNQFKSAKRPIGARQRNSLSISSPLLASQLSKSAPVKTLPIEQMIWSRRDPRPHMNSICSNQGDSSIADEVSEVMNSLSPSELNDIDSEDETYNKSEFETEEAQMSDLDIKPDLRIDEEDEGGEGSSRKDRFFWQYNVQAKGPKGQKLALDTKIVDPHAPIEVIDPVFSDSVQVHGIKHSGKARRGDGNDLTANPKKLAVIGKELDKINKDINNIPPVSEVPFSTRTKSRKEKNKLASRACRLKKKAQHEANKLKLHGLEEEHNELMHSIQMVKDILHAKWTGGSHLPQGATQPINTHEDLTREAENILNRSHKIRVAGNTTEYVNRMITKYS